MRRTGYTLFELLVVLAILGLVSAVAVLRVGGGYQRAQLRRSISLVQEADRQARVTAAARRSPLDLRIDLDAATLELREPGRSGKPVAALKRLPGNIKIDHGSSRLEDRSSGELVVRYDRWGRGDSYALRLSASAGGERWVVFAGATGQAEESLTERSVEDLFRALRKNRVDAH